VRFLRITLLRALEALAEAVETAREDHRHLLVVAEYSVTMSSLFPRQRFCRIRQREEQVVKVAAGEAVTLARMAVSEALLVAAVSMRPSPLRLQSAKSQRTELLAAREALVEMASMVETVAVRDTPKVAAFTRVDR
jgi:hypothetical protein